MAGSYTFKMDVQPMLNYLQTEDKLKMAKESYDIENQIRLEDQAWKRENRQETAGLRKAQIDQQLKQIEFGMLQTARANIMSDMQLDTARMEFDYMKKVASVRADEAGSNMPVPSRAAMLVPPVPAPAASPKEPNKLPPVEQPIKKTEAPKVPILPENTDDATRIAVGARAERTRKALLGNQQLNTPAPATK